MEEKSTMGRIHSIETGGIVDGPGIRYVLFMQGCALRCKYCHNPDTWDTKCGKVVTAEEVFLDILKYKNFIKNGGVTITGGEPLLQSDFVAEVFRRCREANLHTAVDTSGAIPLKVAQKVLKHTDLILLDIKANDSALCKELTGHGNERAFEMLAYANQEKIAVWIRHVLVPGYTDSLEAAQEMAMRLKGYSCIERFEILPFHKFGEYKWEALKIPYTLKDTPVPSAELVEKMKKIFVDAGFFVPMV